MSREKTVPERIRVEKKKCIKLARTESSASRDGRQRSYAVYQTSLRLERIQAPFSAGNIEPRVQGANGNQGSVSTENYASTSLLRPSQ